MAWGFPLLCCLWWVCGAWTWHYVASCPGPCEGPEYMYMYEAMCYGTPVRHFVWHQLACTSAELWYRARVSDIYNVQCTYCLCTIVHMLYIHVCKVVPVRFSVVLDPFRTICIHTCMYMHYIILFVHKHPVTKSDLISCNVASIFTHNTLYNHTQHIHVYMYTLHVDTHYMMACACTMTLVCVCSSHCSTWWGVCSRWRSCHDSTW